MTDVELKQLKDKLWHAADVLRAGAHLAANKYGQPILGLIFLRYADILYKQHKTEIDDEYNKTKGTRAEKSVKEISIKICGFYLPPEAYYSQINSAPDDANKAVLVKNAMEAIERENPKMDGVLPKEVYGQLVPEEEPELLSKIMRIFMDIPENISVDLFGEIYEFFLGEFALQEGKDGGTFYTPATVVRYMVEVLQPENGDKKILDPACGSGGMFVQAARFNTYGIPKNKSKSAKKGSDKKETVPNANYLWISYFASSLKETGKAALVMANSASDAGGSELEIRKKMIEEGIISQMVTLSSNMFSSVTLPATLWFFDKQKTTTEKKDEILFVDARSVFTQVDRAHRKFSDEQIKNLGIISRLYEGDTQSFTDLIDEYQKRIDDAKEKHDFEVEAENKSFTAFYPEYEKQMKGKKNEEKELAASRERHQMILDTIESNYTQTAEYFTAQIHWLKERFPEGKYQDVIGLCKVAKLEGEDGIIDQDYSLNPGRYVGVVIEDDGMTEEEFKETMLSLNGELSKLNAEARNLESEIERNLKGLFG